MQPATLLPTAWRLFADRLADTLDGLPDDHFLVLSSSQRQRFVQFAGAGSWGVRADSISNAYLPAGDRLGAANVHALAELGWQAPNQVALGTRARGEDRDGSPNWFRHFHRPMDLGAIVALALRTLREVHGVLHPRQLHYKAFTTDGREVLYPSLLVEREPSPNAASSDATGDTVPLLLRVAEAAAVEADDDGVAVTGERTMSLTVDGMRLTIVVEEERLLARIVATLQRTEAFEGDLHAIVNTINARHIAFGYTYERDGEVRYAAEFLLEPFYPALIPVALTVAASVVRALQSRHDEGSTLWTVLPDA